MASSAAIYARVSSDPQGTRLAVRRQEADCAALAERRGWTVAETYIDDDISAYRGAARPAYRRLLADLKAGLRDGVIVYHLDRLHRHPKELEEFLEICASHRIRDLATVTGDVDLATHDGQLYARILGAMARKESDDKSRRILRKHLELAEAGKVGGGGTRPFGFEPDRRTIRTQEAEVIREVAARVLAGDSLRSVCLDLATRGVQTPTGRSWGQHTLRHMLLSARISGEREHRGEIVAVAEWPAIIPATQGVRLRALLRDPARRTNRAARKYLLASLLRCGCCHSTMRARPRGDGARRYVCARGPGLPGCGKTFILAQTLEAFVVAAVLERLDSPQLAAALTRNLTTDAQSANAQRELEEAEAQLDELADAWGKRAITAREWESARAPIARRAEAAKATVNRDTRISAVADYLGRGERLRNAWDQLSLQQRQAIVRALFEFIEIGPAVRGRNHFDPGRLTPRWRT
jgi:site-specific DNA recombinase